MASGETLSMFAMAVTVGIRFSSGRFSSTLADCSASIYDMISAMTCGLSVASSDKSAFGSPFAKKLKGLDARVLDTLSKRFLAVDSPKAFSSTDLA